MKGNKMGHDIIVIGTSAGGLKALKMLVARLPGDLKASLFMVMHILPTSQSVLPEILGRLGPLPVHHGVYPELEPKLGIVC